MINKPERSNARALCKFSKIRGEFLVNLNIVFSRKLYYNNYDNYLLCYNHIAKNVIC